MGEKRVFSVFGKVKGKQSTQNLLKTAFDGLGALFSPSNKPVV